MGHSGRTTYVEPYVKSDGTRVKGHVRHVHGDDGRQGGRPSDAGTASGRCGDGGTDARRADGSWDSLRSDWRQGAKGSNPPKGGIDPASLQGGAVCEVAGDRLSISMPMPSNAPTHPTIEEVTVRMSDPATQEMLVATYKRGQVSRTKNQRKWLAAEMSDDDRESLAHDYDESVIYSNKVVHMSKHLKDKIGRGELSVPQDVVEETIKSFSDSFLEYNVTEYRGRQSRRVLLRNNDIVRQVRVRGEVQDANLCIVLDIDTCCMVTAYWNATNDHHDTLNRSRYEAPQRDAKKPDARRQGPTESQRQGQAPASPSDGHHQRQSQQVTTLYCDEGEGKPPTSAEGRSGRRRGKRNRRRH